MAGRVTSDGDASCKCDEKLREFKAIIGDSLSEDIKIIVGTLELLNGPMEQPLVTLARTNRGKVEAIH